MAHFRNSKRTDRIIRNYGCGNFDEIRCKAGNKAVAKKFEIYEESGHRVKRDARRFSSYRFTKILSCKMTFCYPLLIESRK